ncbi:MAG: alkaline phosphatase family protein, partial [Sphaerochaetaceae bacterium]
MKLFLFGFDGLRPDCIAKETMPNLTRFLQNNIQFTNHRSVFPSETYVNHPSIYTGFLPYRHGLVANAFFDRTWSREEYFVGNSVEKIEAIEKATKGMLYEVPSLLETLTAHGKSMLSVSSNSAGSTRLMAHKASALGSINISTCGLQYALPRDLQSRFGSDPPDGKYPRPDIPGLKKVNEIVNHLFSKQGVPDLSIIWYGEPDNTFHAFGIGSEQSKAVLKVADECFAEILSTWADEETYIVVLSDHGHITV